MERRKIPYRTNVGRLKSVPSKFCAKCLFPSDDRKADVCAVCGSKDGFIGFYDRVRRDRILPHKWKSSRYGDALALICSALLIGIFCVVRLADFAKNGVYWNGGEFVFPALLLQIVPVIGALYILFKRERLLGWLFLLAMPVISMILLLTRDPVLCLLSSLYFAGTVEFFLCAHHVEFYEPYYEEETAPDKSRAQWKCTHCGYINGAENVECRSCGKYK